MIRELLKSAALFAGGMIRHDTSPKVVFYHDVGTKYTPMGTPEDLFWSHMAYLQELSSSNEFKFKSGISDIHSRTRTNDSNSNPTLQSPTPTLLSNFHEVAFDDGFRGIWDHREAMRLFDVHPTVFIAIDLVGKPGYLTWDEIRTLQNEYGFNFQSHTWSHQTLIGPINTDLPAPSDLNFRTDAWYHHELVDSKFELERQLNQSVTSLCFPVGYFSDDVIRRCIAAGYTTLYASFPGNKDDNSILPLQLLTPTKLTPRILCQSLSLFAFKCVLHGGMNPLKKHYLKRHYINTPQL